MAQMQGETTTTNQSPSTSSLLVVDDNSMNRIMLSRYITRLDSKENPAKKLDNEA